MVHRLKALLTIAVILILAASAAPAQSEEKFIVALKTDDFELTETDISSLAIGEGKTIETQDGKVIDILRTAAGAEVYLDGELIDMSFSEQGLEEKPGISKSVEVICDHETGCDRHIVVHGGGEDGITEFITEDGKEIIIHKEMEVSCATDENEETACSDKIIVISHGDAFDVDVAADAETNGETRKIIVVSVKSNSEN